jgi:hypothetical protein
MPSVRVCILQEAPFHIALGDTLSLRKTAVFSMLLGEVLLFFPNFLRAKFHI